MVHGSLFWYDDVDFLDVIFRVEAPSAARWRELRMRIALVNRTWYANVCVVIADMRWAVYAPLSCGIFGANVPRSATDVVVAAVPVCVAGDMNGIFMHIDQAVVINGLEISRPFHFHGDPVPDNDLDYNREIGDFTDSFSWGDEHWIMVELFFELPRIAPSQNGMLDVTGLPTVFRACVGLYENEVCPEHYMAGCKYSYKRVACAPIATTVRELWNAIAQIEGWDMRDKCDFFMHHKHAPECLTVMHWFNCMRPNRDGMHFTNNKNVGEWNMDGRDTMCFAWPSCRLKHKFNKKHYHSQEN